MPKAMNDGPNKLPSLPPTPPKAPIVDDQVPEATSRTFEAGSAKPPKSEPEATYEDTNVTDTKAPESDVQPTPVKRGRGRPKKAVQANVEPPMDIDAIRNEVLAQVRAEMAAEKAKVASANSLASTEINEADPSDPDAVQINFKEDGLTLLGQVWVRGQELTVKRGSEEWKQTLDNRGRSVLEYSEKEQLARWQRRFFAQGPWIGDGYDLNDPNLTPEERATLEAMEERRRIRSAQPGAKGARQRLHS